MVRRVAVLFAVALFAAGVYGQSIVTYAGGGTLDGQLLSDILASGASGITLDGAGNIIVVMRLSGQVLKANATTHVVTTLAGNGASGFAGDGGLAVNATLRQPFGVALDGAGNIFVADTNNNVVRRIDAATGIITTYAGGGTPNDIGDGGPATAAQLGGPIGVAIDRGALYITENAYNANRVRRVDMATGIITTIAGATDGSRGGFGGDGGPAKNAIFNNPLGIAIDPAGNIFVADDDNARIRRIDLNGNISTYAGGGAAGNVADGIPATTADLGAPIALAFDRNGNLLLSATGGIRRVDKATGSINTVVPESDLLYAITVDTHGTIYYTDGYSRISRFVAGATAPEDLTGTGVYVGDGLRADAAILHSPEGLAVDAAGNLYIVDQDANIVRRVAAADRTISTVAGVVGRAYSSPDQEGTPATQSAIGFPTDVAFDAANNLYIADELNGRIWRVDAAGVITTFAGGGSPADGVGDGGPATAANIIPWGISFDRSGNLYIADKDSFATIPHARVRKMDAVTKVITTIAGSAALGYAGDGGPATQAQLSGPVAAVVDSNGDVFISDADNGAIRRIDHTTGFISTYAGHKGESDPLGDGGPSVDARISPLHLTLNRTTGDLYAPDHSSHRLRKIDRNGIISTVAGSGTFYLDGGFAGDNGPATSARLSFDYGDVSGVALNANGDLFLSDSQNNRVRAIFACVAVTAPQLAAPANNTSGVATAPRLSWGSVTAAFRYDVKLDTVNPPVTVVATDLDGTSFTPSNLQPSTKYYWQVVAKGDRYCPAPSSGTSTVSAFTTNGICAAGSFDLLAPADGATNVPGSPVHLGWGLSSGALVYDLYLGTSNPPPLLVSNLDTRNYDVQVPGTVYWFVVAHAACDATKTAATPIRSFTTDFPASCGIVAPAVTAGGPNGATGEPTSTTIGWSAAGSIDSFDVYFGTTPTPPLLQGALPATTRFLVLPLLTSGQTYYWRVVARGVCVQQGGISTPVQNFTTATSCPTPGTPQITFAPQSVSAGATYAIVWSPASSLGADGGYLVERSIYNNFVFILDAQVTSSTAASFVAAAPGTIYHRVRAVPGCDPTKTGALSNVASVSVTSAPPNVIFTVQPQGVVTALGDRLEDVRGSFTLENIGASAVQVIVGRQEIDSPPFFSIAGDAAFITLDPRTPKTFTLRYSGPPNNIAGSYQGVIFVAATGQGGLAITPYAFVNLKVGGGNASKPTFLVDGSPSDYVAFPGFSGDDAARPARQVSIRNDGTAPMELAAEIGPDVWLAPNSDWNATALAPGATRTINLFTQRSRAPNGSALPRYTYFTVRTKDGARARLLVQDNDAITVNNGRAAALDPASRTFIVPSVVSATSGASHHLVTRMRLTNLGGDAVQTELVFTPAGRDGFDTTAVRRAIVLVPPNDVVAVTDPIVQLFGLAAPATGQIEVRLPKERVGLVSVRSSIVVLGAPGGFDTPVVTRGEGARNGAPHVVYLPTSSTVSLTLAETSGNDTASVHVVTFDANGSQTSTSPQTLSRYGSTTIANLAATRIEIDVDSGGGSVIGLATLTKANGESGATVLSRAVTEQSSNASAVTRAYDAGRVVSQAVTALSVTTVVPILGSGTSAYPTSVGFVAPPTASATFTAVLHASGGASVGTTKSVTLPADGSQFYTDILSQLFGAAPGQGSVFVSAPSTSKVYALVSSGNASTPAPTSYLSLPTTFSEALTSAATAAQRTLAYDGLDQSTDPTQGNHWLLVLNEVAGASGSVDVRLYEAANRTSPIAEQTFTVAAYQQLTLDSVFSTLGLDQPDRSKDRTNVQVVVTATSGGARLSATAVSISNVTGEAQSYALTPAVGSGTPNIVFVSPAVTPGSTPASPNRRRIVGH